MTDNAFAFEAGDSFALETSRKKRGFRVGHSCLPSGKATLFSLGWALFISLRGSFGLKSAILERRA